MTDRKTIWKQWSADRRRHFVGGLVVVLVFSGLAAVYVGRNLIGAANSGKIYVTPATKTLAVGENVTVEVRVDTGDEQANAAEARLTYDAAKLEFTSVSGEGSVYGVDAESKGGSGSVIIARGNIQPVSGDGLLGKVTFKSLSGGEAKIDVTAESRALRPSDQADIITERTGATMTVNTPQPTQNNQTGSIYLSPASRSVAPGDVITTEVRVDSGSEAVNAAEARLTYSTSQLEFVSVSGSGSAYGIEAPSSGGNGLVTIARGNITALTGDKLLGTVKFKALTAGSAAVTVSSESQALRASDQTNVIGNRKPATYAIVAPVVAQPNPNPTPTPTPPAPVVNSPTRPAPTSTASTPIRRTTGQTISLTPRGATTQTPVPADSMVNVTTPTIVQPADDVSEISKIEYYLRGKLIATVTQPPFSYEVDTTQLRNGAYELTTKTYKSDGSIATAKHTMNVANPMNLAQIALQAKHYWWLLAIIAILMVDVITTLYLRHKNHRSGSALDFLMPWRNSAPALSYLPEGYAPGNDTGANNPYFTTPTTQTVQPQTGMQNENQQQTQSQNVSNDRFEHFSPNLPQAGQIVAPRDDTSDNDRY